MFKIMLTDNEDEMNIKNSTLKKVFSICEIEHFVIIAIILLIVKQFIPTTPTLLIGVFLVVGILLCNYVRVRNYSKILRSINKKREQYLIRSRP